MPTVIDPGLARELRALNDDPTPIVEALEPFPRTLVHSDIRPANLAIRDEATDDPGAVLIDWGRPVFTVPSIDLGYHLGWTALERAASVDGEDAAAERAVFAWWEGRIRKMLRLLDGVAPE